MHIPSERVYREMNSEAASLWYLPANDGEEVSFLIKAPTSSIKALIAGCSLHLFFGKKDSLLCTGVKILDMPGSPVFISGIQRYFEEHHALIRALKERKFPVFLFNEMDICLAWSTLELTEKDAYNALEFIGQESDLYVGSFTTEASHVLDCFGYSVDTTNSLPNAHAIPICETCPDLENWQIIHNHFLSDHDSYAIIASEKDEGETFERAIWASLSSVFPSTLYKSPQVRIGGKMRELTDVFSFHSYGSFLIEAKDVSVLNAGYHRDQARRTAGVQKQIKKAITQLMGASKAFARDDVIFKANGDELIVDRTLPPHCIVLITELMHWGDWEEIVNQLMEAMKRTGTFFNLLDLHELIALLKVSSGKAELFDYNLMKRCKLFVEKQSVFIRIQPSRSLPP